MLDRRAVPLSRVPAFGWAWHGLMLNPRGSSVVTIYLPNGGTYVGSNTGRQRVLRPESWTYLWNIGRSGLEPTDVETARGARFDGAAILRGSSGPMYAYGNAYFGTYDPVEIAGWPVRFAGQTGRALLRVARHSGGAPDPDRLELLIYPSMVLGGEPVTPILFNIDARWDAIGQGAGQPDLYDGPEPLAPLVEGVRFNTLDMTADGRSILLGLQPIVTPHLLRMTNVAQWCGLLRLNITGNPGEGGGLGYQLIVEQDRASALGELVDEVTGSMEYVARFTNPAETVSTVKPFPECGVGEVVTVAGFTREPNSSPGVSSYEGTQVYHHGQTGVMAGAWFDAAGVAQVARFDSMRSQTLTTTVTDASSGERRERDVFIAGATQCELSERTLTDDSAYRLNGLITDERVFTLRLYGASGDVCDEHAFRVTSTVDEWFDSTRAPDNQSTGRTVVEYDGAVVFDETSPPEGGTLHPGSGSPFGYPVSTIDARYHAEVGGMSVSEYQIRVLAASNKLLLLGRAVRTEFGPDELTFYKAMTPSGSDDSSITRDADHDVGLQPRAGFDSTDARVLTRGSYNPITHQVERHRADRATFSWV